LFIISKIKTWHWK